MHRALLCARTDMYEVAAAKARSRNLSFHILLIGRFSVPIVPHDERTRHTISQSHAHRVGWSMALASSLLSELEAPFSCT